jgi:peroxiredoxin
VSAVPPDGLLGRPLPDVTLLDPSGGGYRVRQFVGSQPLVLFFYILNGSPG